MGTAPFIPNLDTRCSWVVNIMPFPPYPQNRTPSTHWIRGNVGPKGGLVVLEKSKAFYPCRNSNPGLSSLASIQTALVSPFRDPINLNLVFRKTEWTLSLYKKSVLILISIYSPREKKEYKLLKIQCIWINNVLIWNETTWRYNSTSRSLYSFRVGPWSPEKSAWYTILTHTVYSSDIAGKQ